MNEPLGRQLVRSLKGTTIHVATCRWARPNKVRPWAWGNQATPKALKAEVEGLGMKPCKECDPLGGL